MIENMEPIMIQWKKLQKLSKEKLGFFEGLKIWSKKVSLRGGNHEWMNEWNIRIGLARQRGSIIWARREGKKWIDKWVLEGWKKDESTKINK